jgi:hypothetical protein
VLAPATRRSNRTILTEVLTHDKSRGQGPALGTGLGLRDRVARPAQARREATLLGLAPFSASSQARTPTA